MGLGVSFSPDALSDRRRLTASSIGVMLGVYSSGISGAHINPAVTFANCVFRKFP